MHACMRACVCARGGGLQHTHTHTHTHTQVVILLILTLVSFPLSVIGGISGRNFAAPLETPCRTNKLPREIPALSWHRSTGVQMILAGFLPFSAIYIELYYVFASVWGHQFYSLYGILLLVFLILLVVTSFITIALTYFQVSDCPSTTHTHTHTLTQTD